MPHLPFKPDREFASIHDAWALLIGEQARYPEAHFWARTSSGLVVPVQAPRQLFRGECGAFDTTLASVHRSSTFRVSGNRQLTKADQRTLLDRLVPALAESFVKDQRYGLTQDQAFGLLQHYGLPTEIIDFTGNLASAFAFAGSVGGAIGRVAILTIPEALEGAYVLDFSTHPWADRAQRQAAFGVRPADEFRDLKSDAARQQLNLRWYEFPVPLTDDNFLPEEHLRLLRWAEDPSAGFLRFHITEFVEARGKFSPDLTDWLLERVPIAPYCYLTKGIEGADVIVNFRSAKDLPAFDQELERECSRRYWSSAYPDYRSSDRIDNSWPPQGSIAWDPRTFHGKQCYHTTEAAAT